MTHQDLHRLKGKRSRAGHLHAVPDLGDIAEQVDNGKRLALVERTQPSAIADYMARREAVKGPEPLDLETVERVAADLAVARDSLLAAMKRLDLDRHQDGAADLHVRVGKIANRIDDLGAFLAERYGS